MIGSEETVKFCLYGGWSDVFNTTLDIVFSSTDSLHFLYLVLNLHSETLQKPLELSVKCLKARLTAARNTNSSHSNTASDSHGSPSGPPHHILLMTTFNSLAVSHSFTGNFETSDGVKLLLFVELISNPSDCKLTAARVHRRTFI